MENESLEQLDPFIYLILKRKIFLSEEEKKEIFLRVLNDLNNDDEYNILDSFLYNIECYQITNPLETIKLKIRKQIIQKEMNKIKINHIENIIRVREKGISNQYQLKSKIMKKPNILQPK